MKDSFLSPEERSGLEQLMKASPSEQVQTRLRVLLLSDDGLGAERIATEVGLSTRSVHRWRSRFREQGLTLFSSPDKAPGESGEIAIEPASSAPSEAPLDAPGRDSVPDGVPFPKPMKRPGVEADDALVEAGRKVLRYHFAVMLQNEPGTRKGKDIEALHDMRVAVRRMRVAFEIFTQAFRSRDQQTHLRGLRRIGRALGRVRDLDVFMEKAAAYLEGLPETQRSGLDPLLNHWNKDRQTARRAMLEFLDSPRYRDFLLVFNTFVGTRGAGARKDSQALIVRHSAPTIIYSRLAAVRSFETLLSGATIEQMHELRIEFKKLRYTMEFFREVLGESVKAVIDEIKRVQDHLGDLNDADVACQILQEFLKGWERRQQGLPLSERQNPEPLVSYLAAKHAERHALLVTFQETWGVFDRASLRQDLALAVSAL